MAKEGAAPARPSARPATEPATRRTARTKKNQGFLRRNLPLLIIGAVVVVALIVAVSWYPVRRAITLGQLDTFKPESPSDLTSARLPEAIAAADVYLELVAKNRGWAENAVYTDRGPIEAQLHLCKVVGSVGGLVFLCEKAGLTLNQRVAALDGLAEAYVPGKHDRDRLPGNLEKWAEGNALPEGAAEPAAGRAISAAAIAVIAKANREGAVSLLAAMVARPGTDPLRANHALTALAKMAGNDDTAALGSAIGLLAGTAGDLVLANPQLCDAIRSKSRPSHLKPLIALLGDQRPGIRGLALAGLGAPGMALGDSPDDQVKRRDLGQSIGQRITIDADKAELSGALKAVRTLRLSGSRDAVLALAPKIGELGLDGIDGQALGLIVADACLPAVYSKATPEQQQWAEGTVDALAALLDQPTTRPVGAAGLSRPTSGWETSPALRRALDRLAATADPLCIQTLRDLVSKAYNRPDVAQANGLDSTAWKGFLDKDRPRSAKWAEWQQWIEANGADVSRVNAGRKRLAEAKAYVEAAMKELDGWLAEPNFTAPLGLTTTKLKSWRTANLGTLHFSVQKAFAGSL